MATYACADLHGRYDLYLKIKQFLSPEDTVIFLGDAGDRGPQSWETIKAIYNDTQFIYLKGNHEDMLVEALKDYHKEQTIVYESYSNLCYNGGKQTFEDCLADPFGYECWIKRLDNLPKNWIHHSKSNSYTIFLSHAGCTPGSENIDYLWDREHFYDIWPEGISNVIVVHGHTPIGLMDGIILDANNYNEDEPGAFWYCDNHKINLDVGAVWNDYTVLLNLDTLDEEIIY